MNIVPPPRHQQDEFRPPLVSLVFAGLLGYAAFWLYTGTLRGLEWAPFLSLLLGGCAVLQVIKALNDWYRLSDYRRRVGAFEKAAKDRRPTRFGNTDDLDKSEDFS